MTVGKTPPINGKIDPKKDKKDKKMKQNKANTTPTYSAWKQRGKTKPVRAWKKNRVGGGEGMMAAERMNHSEES